MINNLDEKERSSARSTRRSPASASSRAAAVSRADGRHVAPSGLALRRFRFGFSRGGAGRPVSFLRECPRGGRDVRKIRRSEDDAWPFS